MWPSVSRHVAFLAAITLLSPSCAMTPNPSSTVSNREAEKIIRQMAMHPVRPQRPVLVIGGWHDPGVLTWYMKRELMKVLDPESVVDVSFGLEWSFDDCCEKLIESVEASFPSDDPRWTAEVDVVGHSMGGLVARYAASERGDHRRLRIHRLYTISTPHRGANMADRLPAIDSLHRHMRSDSEFLDRIDADLRNASYEIVPYTRLSDRIVGAGNTAPPDQTPFWVAAKPLQLNHVMAPIDPVIRADIMRRLRSEPTLFQRQTPLPDGQ